MTTAGRSKLLKRLRLQTAFVVAVDFDDFGSRLRLPTGVHGHPDDGVEFSYDGSGGDADLGLQLEAAQKDIASAFIDEERRVSVPAD